MNFFGGLMKWSNFLYTVAEMGGNLGDELSKPDVTTNDKVVSWTKFSGNVLLQLSNAVEQNKPFKSEKKS
jgi:hypothetical protein